MKADCICTGIILVEDDCAYNGDLFQMGDTYIVNCNEASAMSASDVMSVAGVRAITPTGDYWTRKGVYVMKVAEAELSKAAKEYIGN